MSQTTEANSGAKPNASAPNPEFVKNLFDTISPTYDLANDVITFGLARAWRKKTVQMSHAQLGDSVLDCATGTGDLAFEFKRRVGSSGNVIGSDFSAGMLKSAPEKARKLNLEVHFEQADVTQLPYANASFDIASIAYGIRNVQDRTTAIREMARVLKPGGRLMILETGEIQNPLLRIGIRFYFEKAVPVLGGVVSGKKDAYDYLQKSSGEFPSGKIFAKELESSGLFSSVEFQSLMGGASYIYKSVRAE